MFVAYIYKLAVINTNQMNIFDTSKSLVENIYLLSGPVLALLGFAAIIQLRLTKKAIVISAKRSAAELASKQVEIYNKEIIPFQDKLFSKEEKNTMKRIKLKDLEKFTHTELDSRIDKETQNKIIKENIQNLHEILEILNSMEAFSIYFTKGVADEEIAYSSVGRTFCLSIENYSTDICFLRQNDETSAFNNLVKLYSIWNSRVKSEKLSKELEAKKSELKNIYIDKVNIIGTK